MPALEVASLRRSPGAAALGGVVTVVAATLFGCLTWDGQRLVIPLVWLAAAVLATSVVTGLQGGLGAAFTATASLGFSFTEPRWSLRVEDATDVRSTAAFAVMALLIVLTVDAIDSARRRADAALLEQQRTLVLLDGVLDHAPVGIAFFDRDLRFVRVNEELLRMNGLEPQSDLGASVDEVLADLQIGSTGQRVLDTGRPVLDVPLSTAHRITGDPLHVVASYYPVAGQGGAVAGVGAVVRDVTNEVVIEDERELLLSRFARLQAATAALSASRTTEEVVAALLHQVREAASAEAASISLVDGDELVVVGEHGYPADTIRRWSRFPIDAPVPLADAVRSGEPVYAGSRAEIVERWPDLAAHLPPGDRALAALPLVVGQEVIGAVGLSLAAARPDAAGARAFLEAIAAQCSQAVRRAFLNDSEQLARERLAFLADATAALTSTLEPVAAVERLGQLAVPRIADWCSVYLLDHGTIRPVVHAHPDPERADALRRLVERHPVELDAKAGAGAVIRTGEPELREELTPDDLGVLARDEEHLARLREVGMRSMLIVPLQAKGRTLGALALGTSGERRLGGDELAMARDVGRRAGQALLNAELYRERAHIADVLQRSLLPPSHVAVPGVDLAARFVPVGDGIDVGGDFYDVFRLGTAANPHDAYAIVIGDVRGKGSEAAAITAAARHSIRTSGLRTTSPAAMLRELNEVLLVHAAEKPDEVEPPFCTAVIAVVEPTQDRSSVGVTLAVAGHPLPLLLCGDGSTVEIGSPGSLVGVIDDPVIREVQIDVGRGEAIVLYTDGVTERHAGDRFFDSDGLAAAVSRCAGFTAEAMAERIEMAARAFVEDDPRDDLAIVVLRVPTRTGTASSASADLPFDASAPRLARRFLDEVLAALDRGDLVDVGTLLVSELVTNAVLHGAGPVRVSVEPSESHVRVAVVDGAAEWPALRTSTPADLNGRGLLLLDRIAERWGVDDLPAGGKAVWFELA